MPLLHSTEPEKLFRILIYVFVFVYFHTINPHIRIVSIQFSFLYIKLLFQYHIPTQWSADQNKNSKVLFVTELFWLEFKVIPILGFPDFHSFISWFQVLHLHFLISGFLISGFLISGFLISGFLISVFWFCYHIFPIVFIFGCDNFCAILFCTNFLLFSFTFLEKCPFWPALSKLFFLVRIFQAKYNWQKLRNRNLVGHRKFKYWSIFGQMCMLIKLVKMHQRLR